MSNEEKSALEVKRDELEALAKEENDKRAANKDEHGKAKGTRIRVGSTRGKNPQAVSFEVFDEAQPDTLPVTLAEFMSLSGVETEAGLLPLLIDGFNSNSYTQASDPVAEYLDASWPDDVQKQFRIVVRNYANGTGTTIEDAVSLIKPGFSAAVLKSAEAKSE